MEERHCGMFLMVCILERLMWSVMCLFGGQVRTIFVFGFPPDVKERELQNLLRWWPGYEASQMNFKCDQPMGFALFSTAAMAMAARDALQVHGGFETPSSS
jgi:hypothetical protein